MTHDRRRAGINDWERAHTYLLSKARSIACVAPSLKYCLLLNKNKLVSNFYQFINHLKTVETARALSYKNFFEKTLKTTTKMDSFLQFNCESTTILANSFFGTNDQYVLVEGPLTQGNVLYFKSAHPSLFQVLFSHELKWKSFNNRASFLHELMYVLNEQSTIVLGRQAKTVVLFNYNF